MLCRMPDPLPLGLARVLALQVGGLALAGSIAAWRGNARERLGWVPSRLPWDAAVAGVLGLLALSAALDALLSALGLSGTGTLADLDSLAAQAGSRGQSALALVALGLAPGLAEETLFRGLLQRSLAMRLGAGAIPIAALCFGAAHQDAVQSPCAFLLGAYLGALAYLARSTWVAIAGHCANNLLAATAGLLGAADPAPSHAIGTAAVGITLAAVALAHACWRVPRAT
jgi:membrane protease YdiL (CAAX protease family)